ncbi:hypothetical protein D3C81_2045630 [compost metagenome]
MIGIHRFAGAVNRRLIDNEHPLLIGNPQIIGRIRLRMQPDAVDARLSAHAVPIADIALGLLRCTLEVPGIPAQVNWNSVQHKLWAFTPEFPEAERFGSAVDDFPS